MSFTVLEINFYTVDDAITSIGVKQFFLLPLYRNNFLIIACTKHHKTPFLVPPPCRGRGA